MPIIPAYNNDNYVQKLTDMVGQLRQDVDQLIAASKVNQLNYSSLNDTALPIYGTDSAGVAQLKQLLGKQPDGTYSIVYHNGSLPPNPINIGVAQRQLGILVTWDGSFAGNAPRPLDFDRLDVYIGTSTGFTPSVANLMGSLFTDSALFVGADVSPHFVKVATVNKSGVASFPSFEIPVTPLPAAQLAAGSVTAVTLDAELVLASDIIIGDTHESHIVLTPVTGIQLYATDGTTKLVDLNILGGSAEFTGDISTHSGLDKILLTNASGEPVIDLYRTQSPNPAQITAAGQSLTNSADLILRSSPNSSYTPNREGRLEITQDGGVWHWADVTNTGTNRGGTIKIFRSNVQLDVFDAASFSPGSVYLDQNHAYIADLKNGFFISMVEAGNGFVDITTHPVNSTNVAGRITVRNAGDTEIKTAADILFYKDNGSGGILSSSVLRLRQTGGAEPEMMNIFYDVGLRWTNNNKLFVINASGGARAIAASSFDIVSSVQLKRNVTPSTINARDIIAGIDTKSWNYAHEDSAATPHLFPIAEELQEVLPNAVNEDGTVDLRDIVGFLLQLCKEQESELKTMRVELDSLKDRT